MQKTIKKELYQTIHRNNKSIDQIADEIGVSANSIYRYCLEGESGSEMPLSRLVPLMKATKNFELLTHIARICGFLVVKIPKVSANKGTEIDLVDNYQDATTKACRSLKSFFKNQPQKNWKKLRMIYMK